jgi:hypothetical protein
LGEQKEKSDKLFQYGQPPVAGKLDRPLTRAELEERERRLSLLSPHHVADAYRQAHEACRMEGDRLPGAGAFQELVTGGSCYGNGRIERSRRLKYFRYYSGSELSRSRYQQCAKKP